MIKNYLKNIGIPLLVASFVSLFFGASIPVILFFFILYILIIILFIPIGRLIISKIRIEKLLEMDEIIVSLLIVGYLISVVLIAREVFRLVGLLFYTLFHDNLFYELSLGHLPPELIVYSIIFYLGYSISSFIIKNIEIKKTD